MNYSIRLLSLLLCLTIGSCKKKDEVKPPVVVPGPEASFTYTGNAWSRSFTSTSTNTPETFFWEFGDGDTASGVTVSHTYDNPGSYVVSLTVANAQGSSTHTDTILLKEQIIHLKTSFGDMYMYLYNQTPKHRDNFLKLAGEGFFDGTTFHRIIPGFVIQGGDPNSKDADPSNDGFGGPGYDIEFSAPPELKHDFGAVGAASEGAQGPSSGSQFYIVVNAPGTHSLNGKYTVFGFIMKGMDVAQQIVAQPRDAGDRPFDNITMEATVEEKTREELVSEYGYTIP